MDDRLRVFRKKAVLKTLLLAVAVVLASSTLGYTYLTKSRAASPLALSSTPVTDPQNPGEYSVSGLKADSPPPVNLPLYAPGEVIVMYKNPTEAKKVVATLSRKKQYSDLNQTKIRDNTYVVRSNSAKKTAVTAPRIEYRTGTTIDLATYGLLEELKKDPNVKIAELNYLRTLSYQPTDPRYNEQWAHLVSNTAAAWDVTLGNAAVGIAIIDSGIDLEHPDLAPNIKDGYDFVNVDLASYNASSGNAFTPFVGEDYTTPDNVPSDYFGHGTHGAGIAAAKANTTGILGACPNCSIIPLRAGFAINYYGKAVGLLEDDDICAALYAAADNPDVRIINMSFGSEVYSQVVDTAIQYAASKQKILVAAAGNAGSDAPTFPASLPNVISVSALSVIDDLAYYSNYGSWVDIAAPGGSSYIYGRLILSTVPKIGVLSDPSGYMNLQGTSMASSYVAGALGLLLSRSPELSPQRAEQILLGTSDRITSTSGKLFGKGILAVDATLKSPPTVTAEISDITQSTSRGTMTVSGTASTLNSEDFSAYRIVAYAYSSTVNKTLCESTTPVENAQLCTGVSMSLLPNDLSIIELQVETKQGAILRDREYFGERLFEFATPYLQQNFRIGNVITVSTTQEFVPTGNYTVDWSYEGDTAWFTTGVTKKIVGTQLATLNTSQIKNLKTGTLRIRVTKALEGYSKSFITKVFVSSEIKAGWPKTFSPESAQCRVWGVSDLDYDKQKEIIAVCADTAPNLGYYNRIDIYRNGGQRAATFSLAHRIYLSDLVIADFDHDTRKEIVVSGFAYGGAQTGTYITMYTQNGTVLADRMLPLGETTLSVGNFAGQETDLEIAVNTFSNMNGIDPREAGRIQVLDNKLQPIGDTAISYTVRPGVWDGKYNPPRVLVGNTDGDSFDEILGVDYRGSEQQNGSVLEKYAIVSWNADGSVAPGYPKTVSGGWLVLTSLAGAYVDDNKHVDFVAYGTNSIAFFMNGIFKKLAVEPMSPRLPIAIADMNHDGKEEVVFSGSQGGLILANIFSFNGTLLKSTQVRNSLDNRADGRVLIADLANDRSPEILIRDLVPKRNKQTVNGINPYVSPDKILLQQTFAQKDEYQVGTAKQLFIADLQNNGKYDFVYGTLSCLTSDTTGLCKKTFSQIFVSEHSEIGGSPALLWNSPAHDSRQSGNADTSDVTDIAAIISAQKTPNATNQVDVAFTVRNLGGEYARAVAVSIRIPRGITVVKKPATCTQNPPDTSSPTYTFYLCSASYILPGKSTTFRLSTTSTSRRTVSMTASLDPMQHDYQLNNNESAQTITY